MKVLTLRLILGFRLVFRVEGSWEPQLFQRNMVTGNV